MNKLIITKKLHERLKSISAKNSPETVIYLLGKNTDGVIIRSTSVPITTRGCAWMPEASIQGMTTAYMRLANISLAPCALAVIQGTISKKKPGYQAVQGTALYKSKIPFIYYNRGRHAARISSNSSINSIRLRVVNG